jgi:hypothetical protein
VIDFFNEFDAFLTTSRTHAIADRLNARYRAIIEHNLTAIAGRRVLDIASHDGRWSFAALKAGAVHVVGIEPRENLLRNAYATFDRYEVAGDRYTFVQADAFEALKNMNIQVDTVLCLGFLYHTVRHVELADLISRTAASCAIIDTVIVPPSSQIEPALGSAASNRRVYGNRSTVKLFKEAVEHESTAFRDSTTRNGENIVATPSREGLAFIMQHFGFEVEEFNWPDLLGGLSATVIAHCLGDYADGWRSTFCCTRSKC